MRRIKKPSFKIIILVILSGIFNLLSYSFDQLVIQSELKNRELERELTSSRIDLETLSYEISTLNDLSNDINKSSFYFFKHTSINMFNSGFFLTDPKLQEVKPNNIFKDNISKKIGMTYLENLNEMILDFNNKVDEIETVSNSIFPNATYLSPLKNIKISEKLINDFIPAQVEDDTEQKKIDQKNYEIYSDIYDKITKLREHRYVYDFILIKAEDKYITKFSNFFNFVDTYAEQQNKINYYILLSIISQILGILFILLLFKNIILKKY